MQAIHQANFMDIDSCVLPNFKVYGQEKTTWCWAASFAMVYNYENDYTNEIDQKKIVNSVESRKINIDNGFNHYDWLYEHWFKRKIVKKHINDVSFDHIAQTIRKNKPILLSHFNSKLENLDDGFGFSQHAVVISGYKKIGKLNLIKINDPWIKTKDNTCLAGHYYFDFKVLQYFSASVNKVFLVIEHDNDNKFQELNEEIINEVETFIDPDAAHLNFLDTFFTYFNQEFINEMNLGRKFNKELKHFKSVEMFTISLNNFKKGDSLKSLRDKHLRHLYFNSIKNFGEVSVIKINSRFHIEYITDSDEKTSAVKKLFNQEISASFDDKKDKIVIYDLPQDQIFLLAYGETQKYIPFGEIDKFNLVENKSYSEEEILNSIFKYNILNY